MSGKPILALRMGMIPKQINGISLPLAHSKRSEEHTSELQSHSDLVCRLLLEKKNNCRRGDASQPIFPGRWRCCENLLLTPVSVVSRIPFRGRLVGVGAFFLLSSVSKDWLALS